MVKIKSKRIRRRAKNKIRSKRNNVKNFYLKKIMTDEEIADKEGEYFDKKAFKFIVKENADGYYIDEDGEKHLLFRFRKNVIPKKLCKIGMKHLKKYAMKKEQKHMQ